MIPTYLGTQIIVNGLLICVTFYAVLRYKLHFINGAFTQGVDNLRAEELF